MNNITGTPMSYFDHNYENISRINGILIDIQSNFTCYDFLFMNNIHNNINFNEFGNLFIESTIR